MLNLENDTLISFKDLGGHWRPVWLNLQPHKLIDLGHGRDVVVQEPHHTRLRGPDHLLHTATQQLPAGQNHNISKSKSLLQQN